MNFVIKVEKKHDFSFSMDDKYMYTAGDQLTSKVLRNWKDRKLQEELSFDKFDRGDIKSVVVAASRGEATISFDEFGRAVMFKLIGHPERTPPPKKQLNRKHCKKEKAKPKFEKAEEGDLC